MKKQGPRKYVPWFEALEDRRVLSISFTTVPVNQTSFQGAAISSVPTVATDTLVDQVVYSATGLPSNLAINASTGVINGLISPTADTSSVYTVNLTATDTATNDVATASFQWTVNPDPVTFTSPGDRTNANGATITLSAGGADSIAGNTLAYTAAGLPNGLTISSTTGQITGTIAIPSFTISGVTNTVNPTITTTAADNFTVGESVLISGVLGATGVNGTFIVASTPTTTTFTITDPTAPGAYTSGGAVIPSSTVSAVTITATDTKANASNTETFNWTVTPSPVTVTAPATQTNNNGANVSLQVQAADSIAGDTLTYSASALPSGLTINTTTGKITGQISATANTGSPYTVTVTATDAAANSSASQTFTWNVNPGPVTLTKPANQTSSGLAVIKLKVTATDSTAGDKLTYSATGLPSGLAINPTTGIIAGTIAQTANSTTPYNVTVTATDTAANASASQTFTWTVNPGPIDGVVFFDANGDGKFDAGDARLTGVTVVLTGSANSMVNVSAVTNTVNPTITTSTNDNLSVGNSVTIANVGGATGVNGTFVVASILSETSFTINLATAPGTYTSGGTVNDPVPISLSTTTNATGNFSFVNPPLGTYSIKVNPVAALKNAKPSIANLVSPAGATVTNNNAPVVTKPTNAGLGSGTVSLTQFLTTTENLNQPFGPVGTGLAVVNSAPTASKAIPAVSLSATTTTSNVDLAGFFSDADMANSSVTMNITDGLVFSKITNVTNVVNPTITTAAADNLVVGDTVKIAGVAGATGVNGTFTVASTPTSTTFTITLATAPGAYTSGGTVTPSAGITGVTNVVDPTITTSVAHGLKVGDVVSISGIVGATGANGTFTVATVPSATTFTVVTNAAPGVYTSGGFVSAEQLDKLNLTMFDKLAPQTVANFFDYIKSGEYNNSIFSRLVNNFVLQGGGATFNPTTSTITSIAIGPKVPNEFKTPNTEGTLAMAQAGSDANSATDQFFINTVNNSATGKGTNLDASKFTVFAKLADTASQTALNALTATSTFNASSSTAGTANPTVDMNNIPLTGYTGGTGSTTSSTFASDATANEFMTIQSVTINKQPEFLTYSVVSSNPSIVAASLDPVHNEQLTLTRGTSTGTATITVTATDRFGLSTTSTITVTVS